MQFMVRLTMTFLHDCRAAMRVRHLAYRTEQSYLHWIKRYCLFRKTQQLK